VNVRTRLLAPVASALLFSAAAAAQTEDASRTPTWRDEIAKGFIPYHQLTVEDFPIDDKTQANAGYSVRPFIHPLWRYVMTRRDWYYAYVEQWTVFSGFDKNQSWRKSKFREMKESLPHVQAYLDLNEICARQMAALKPGELPSGRGATPEEAAKALADNMNAFIPERYKGVDTEADQFQKATNRGANKKKVRELGKEIRKRLDAIPPPAGPAYELPAPSPTPSPSAKAP
jgi:hypothetical protein